MSDGWRIGIAALAPEAQTEWVRQHTEALRAECERLRGEADRAWVVLDWLAENNPAALELSPYKAKR